MEIGSAKDAVRIVTNGIFRSPEKSGSSRIHLGFSWRFVTIIHSVIHCGASPFLLSWAIRTRSVVHLWLRNRAKVRAFKKQIGVEWGSLNGKVYLFEFNRGTFGNICLGDFLLLGSRLEGFSDDG